MNTQTKKPKQEVLWIKGSDLVGLDSSSSENPNVQRAKELCAELADLLNKPAPFLKEEIPSGYGVLYNEAMLDILKAEMMVVNLLNFK